MRLKAKLASLAVVILLTAMAIEVDSVSAKGGIVQVKSSGFTNDAIPTTMTLDIQPNKNDMLFVVVSSHGGGGTIGVPSDSHNHVWSHIKKVGANIGGSHVITTYYTRFTKSGVPISITASVAGNTTTTSYEFKTFSISTVDWSKITEGFRTASAEGTGPRISISPFNPTVESLVIEALIVGERGAAEYTFDTGTFHTDLISHGKPIRGETHYALTASHLYWGFGATDGLIVSSGSNFIGTWTEVLVSIPMLTYCFACNYDPQSDPSDPSSPLVPETIVAVFAAVLVAAVVSYGAKARGHRRI